MILNRLAVGNKKDLEEFPSSGNLGLQPTEMLSCGKQVSIVENSSFLIEMNSEKRLLVAYSGTDVTSYLFRSSGKSVREHRTSYFSLSRLFTMHF